MIHKRELRDGAPPIRVTRRESLIAIRLRGRAAAVGRHETCVSPRERVNTRRVQRPRATLCKLGIVDSQAGARRDGPPVDEGLVLTGGVADDTREQPCLHPHPDGGEQSQWTQELETDAVDLARGAQQQVLSSRTPRVGLLLMKASTPPPTPSRTSCPLRASLRSWPSSWPMSGTPRFPMTQRGWYRSARPSSSASS